MRASAPACAPISATSTPGGRRDGNRGVYGRQIALKIYDDQYSESQTVQQTRRAVEQDQGLRDAGRAGHREPAGRAGVPERPKVPQLYVSTGLSEFGKKYSEFHVDDRLAAGLHQGGHAARPVPAAEPAERACGGAPPERRLRQGVPVRLPQPRQRAGRSSRSRAYPRGGGAGVIAGAAARLRASGADTFLVIATPTETITALVTAYRLGWRPTSWSTPWARRTRS